MVMRAGKKTEILSIFLFFTKSPKCKKKFWRSGKDFVSLLFQIPTDFCFPKKLFRDLFWPTKFWELHYEALKSSFSLLPLAAQWSPPWRHRGTMGPFCKLWLDGGIWKMMNINKLKKKYQVCYGPSVLKLISYSWSDSPAWYICIDPRLSHRWTSKTWRQVSLDLQSRKNAGLIIQLSHQILLNAFLNEDLQAPGKMG